MNGKHGMGARGVFEGVMQIVVASTVFILSVVLAESILSGLGSAEVVRRAIYQVVSLVVLLITLVLITPPLLDYLTRKTHD